jgi:RNA polymerase sigma-70 factor (sigma-E family)
MTSAPREDADTALIELFSSQYAGLVRLASLLVRSSGEAEELVQDAFVAMHAQWSRLREPDKAAAYLRRTVVNAARSAHRRHAVADKHQATLVDVPSGTDSAAAAADSRAIVITALHRLPQRQREVLVLRYYSDLSEAGIADALGISRGAVKSHSSRGLAALRSILEEAP